MAAIVLDFQFIFKKNKEFRTNKKFWQIWELQISSVPPPVQLKHQETLPFKRQKNCHVAHSRTKIQNQNDFIPAKQTPSDLFPAKPARWKPSLLPFAQPSDSHRDPLLAGTLGVRFGRHRRESTTSRSSSKNLVPSWRRSTRSWWISPLMEP